MSYNPYDAHEADVVQDDVVLLTEPKRLPIGMGWDFWRDAFTIFKQNALSWFLCGLAYIGIIIVLSLLSAVLPIIADMVIGIIGLILVAGFSYKAHLQVSEEDNSVSDIFAGFQVNVLRQIGLYFVFFIGMVIAIVVAAVVATSVLGAGVSDLTWLDNLDEFGVMTILLLLLVMLLFIMPLLMMVWFAPILIFFHDLSIIQAMSLSFKACLANILPFFWYSVVFVLFALIASLPVMLGWLVLLPLFMLTYYSSYRHILTA